MSGSEVVLDAEVVEPISGPDAERLDKKIRLLVGSINDSLAKLHYLVEEAKRGEIHKALGFASWTAYLADAFTVQVRLDRDQRRELVGYLSGEGMSQRVISDVVGTSVGTVNADLAGVQNRTPGEEQGLDLDDHEVADCLAMADLPEDAFEEVLAEARAQEDLSRESVAQKCRERATPTSVVGRDGKTYEPKPKPEPLADAVVDAHNAACSRKRRRRPITEAFRDSTYDATKIAGRLARLIADDRFSRNRDVLRSGGLGDLIRVRDALNEVIDALDGGR